MCVCVCVATSSWPGIWQVACVIRCHDVIWQQLGQHRERTRTNARVSGAGLNSGSTTSAELQAPTRDGKLYNPQPPPPTLVLTALERRWPKAVWHRVHRARAPPEPACESANHQRAAWHTVCPCRRAPRVPALSPNDRAPGQSWSAPQGDR